MVNLLRRVRMSGLLAYLRVGYHKKSPSARHSGPDSLLLISTLLAVVLSCFAFSSYATGPSSTRIYLKPVTHNNKGIVLFKAYKNIDYTGGASDKKYSFLWLVVSASGIWEETPHKILKQPEYSQSNVKSSFEKEERKQSDFRKTVDFYYDEFASELDWEHPPKSLLPLIKKYGFKPRPGLDENERHGSVAWSSKNLCMNGNCVRPTVPQRTLGGRFSSEAHINIERKGEELIEVESKAIQNVFYHAGVALFRNGNYKIENGKYEESSDLEDDSIGATFDFYKKGMGDQIIDFEYIDAISIVPKHIRRPTNTPAKRSRNDNGKGYAAAAGYKNACCTSHAAASPSGPI